MSTRRRLMLSLLIALPGLLPTWPARAAEQVLSFGPGFNFVAPTVRGESPLTSTALLADIAVQQVFRFDPASQSFRYQLRLADGRLFGAPFDCPPGEGIVVAASGAATRTLSGVPERAAATPSLGEGFSLRGFPPLLTAATARGILVRNAAVESLFAWDRAAQSFRFVLRLPDGALFGPDFPLASGEGFFVRSAGATTAAFGLLPFESATAPPPAATETKRATVDATGGKVALDDGVAVSVPEHGADGAAEVEVTRFDRQDDFGLDPAQRVLDVRLDPGVRDASLIVPIPAGRSAADLSAAVYDPVSGNLVPLPAGEASGGAVAFPLVRDQAAQAPGIVRAASDPATKRVIVEVAGPPVLTRSEVILPLPYYEQDGDNCWAAVLLMFLRSHARTPSISSIPAILAETGVHKDLGLGWWSNGELVRVARKGAGVECEGRFWLSLRAMFAHIAESIDSGRPVMVNMVNHQGFFIGYRVDETDPARPITLVYHDPQNNGEQQPFSMITMERMASRFIGGAYENLVSVKATVRATAPALAPADLQTVQLLNGFDTSYAAGKGLDFAFRDIAAATGLETGIVGQRMIWDHTAPRGLRMHANSAPGLDEAIRFDEIRLGALPLWNLDASPVQVVLRATLSRPGGAELDRIERTVDLPARARVAENLAFDGKALAAKMTPNDTGFEIAVELLRAGARVDGFTVPFGCRLFRIEPVLAEAAPGAEIQLAALLGTQAVPGATWSTREAGGGSFTPAGLWTTPFVGGEYTVVAKDPSVRPNREARMTVTVHGLRVEPAAAWIGRLETQGFVAMAKDQVMANILWSVGDGSYLYAGSINPAGLFTPDAPGEFPVSARSEDEPRLVATAQVKVAGCPIDAAAGVAGEDAVITLAPVHPPTGTSYVWTFPGSEPVTTATPRITKRFHVAGDHPFTVEMRCPGASGQPERLLDRREHAVRIAAGDKELLVRSGPLGSTGMRGEWTVYQEYDSFYKRYDDVRHGYFRVWDDHDTQVIEGEYTDGQPSGTWTVSEFSYYENKRYGPTAVLTYETPGGDAHGTERTHYDGEVVGESDAFARGTVWFLEYDEYLRIYWFVRRYWQVGPYKRWHTTTGSVGALAVEGQNRFLDFSRGSVRVGIWKIYREDGTLEKTITYDDEGNPLSEVWN